MLIKSVFQGVVGGVTGIVTKPVEGTVVCTDVTLMGFLWNNDNKIILYCKYTNV